MLRLFVFNVVINMAGLKIYHHKQNILTRDIRMPSDPGVRFVELCKLMEFYVKFCACVFKDNVCEKDQEFIRLPHVVTTHIYTQSIYKRKGAATF